MTPHEIKTLRARLAMTQADLAGAVGVTVQAVRHWEQGLRTPSGSALTVLRRLAGGTDDVAIANRDEVSASWDRAEAAWGKWRGELVAGGDAGAVRVADHVLRLARATKRRLGTANDD